MDSFDRLVDIMATLRGPEGCPWDRAQSHQTLRRYLLEETCEALDALDSGDDQQLQGELGDLLLQIVFHAQLASETGRFSIDDVCTGIADKLVRRHPHVFAGLAGVEDAAQVLPVWEAVKLDERGGAARASTLDGVPASLPALPRSYELQRRAAKVGFEWPDLDSRLKKVAEELRELAAAVESGGQADVESEFGDLLFTVVNIGRNLGCSAEDALRRANAKFERRFRAIEQAAGGAEAFAALDLAQQDELWNAYKRTET